MTEERGALHLFGVVVELDDGELGRPVDGEKHDQLAFGQAKLAAVDVNEADLGVGEVAALGGLCVRRYCSCQTHRYEIG